MAAGYGPGVAEELRPVSAEVAELGEGARWDADRGELLWVDILAGVLRRAVEDGPGLRTVQELRIGEPLGAAAPLAGGDGWLLAAGRGFRRLHPGGTVTALLDTEGALWVALHGAGEVRRYGPDGATLHVWPLPVSQPTSVAIGGAGGRRLFVTTSWENLDRAQRAAQPDAGRVFAAGDAGVEAPPVRAYRGALPAAYRGPAAGRHGPRPGRT